jgi:hypothetical protein
MKIFLILIITLTSSIGHTQISSLRGQRYCEVLIGEGKIFKGITLDVYNTIGLNFCPQEQWGKLNEKKIKKEWDADFVKLNGPRFWTMDAMKSTLLNPTIVSFNGIEMRKAGILKLGYKEILGKRSVYKERKVRRNSIWIFNPYELVYELVSPDNKVFIMQSYSSEVKDLTLENLKNLKSQLKLPKGWSYRARMLNEELQVPIPQGLATVIQDNLYNSYTLIE